MTDKKHWYSLFRNSYGGRRETTGFGFAVFMTVAVLASILVIGFFAVQADKRGCATRAHGQGYAYRFDMFAGCRYVIGSREIPEDVYRRVQVER